MGSEPELARDFEEKLKSVLEPGKSETWIRNKARQAIKLLVLIPAVENMSAEKAAEMQFAGLGSVEGLNNLPTKLIGSSTQALSRVFPSKSLQENRKIVIDALTDLRRKARSGENAFKSYIDSKKPSHS